MKPAAPGRPARIELLCIGTELLSGKINTHIGWLAGALQDVGLRLARESSLGDAISEIRSGIRDAYSRSEVVLVSGGLGPTFDDLTREGASEALGAPLRYHPDVYAKIRARIMRHYRRVPEENRRQAYVLEGARVLDNRYGSAPGQLLRRGGKILVLLPGPAWELQPMFAQQVLPVLKTAYAPKTCVRKAAFHLAGITESAADEKLTPLVARPRPGIEFTILASIGLVDFHVTASGDSRVAAERLLATARKEVLRRVGRYVYGVDSDTLESAVGDILRRRRLRLATAESCTAGLLSERLTSVAGSSDYYVGGVISYANDVKRDQLGVRETTLKKSGAVSEPCAREMAEGALRRLGSDLAVSITGVAGPGGGTPAKPVGLAFIGLARKGRPTRVERYRFSGLRHQIRDRAAIAALTLLWRELRRRSE